MGFVKTIVQGNINSLGMKPLDIEKVGNSVKSNNRGNNLLFDIKNNSTHGLPSCH